MFIFLFIVLVALRKKPVGLHIPAVRFVRVVSFLEKVPDRRFQREALRGMYETTCHCAKNCVFVASRRLSPSIAAPIAPYSILFFRKYLG